MILIFQSIYHIRHNSLGFLHWVGFRIGNWDVWLDGAGLPPPDLHLTQVLTGHGCFSEYLHRIRKEATARCHHCDASVDSAQHTLEFCLESRHLQRVEDILVNPPSHRGL